MEIQRLIGRSMRAAVDLTDAGRRGPSRWTATCSRRTAARAPPPSPAPTWRWCWRCASCKEKRRSSTLPQLTPVAAVSVGMVKGEVRVDLDYDEDSSRRRGHEHRGHRRRQAGRGAGHRRARGLRAQAAGRDAGRGPGRHRASWSELQKKVLGWSREAALRHHQPGQAAELRAAGRADAVEVRLAGGPARRRPSVGGGRGHLRGERRKKALAYAEATGLPALADDSGLCVDALGGRPGVHSARYAPGDDRARCQKLLGELDGRAGRAAAARRSAARCAWRSPGGRARSSRWARCEGGIGHAPRGAHGFGYDPVFVVAGAGQDDGGADAGGEGARLAPGQAFRKMRPHLLALSGVGERRSSGRPCASVAMVQECRDFIGA